MPPSRPGCVSSPQPWREDASNQDLAHTRNRIRWQLLPLLRTFNPQIAAQLARLATISADEEAYWQAEVEPPSAWLCCCRAGPPGVAAAPPAPIRRRKRWPWSRPGCASCHPAVARRVVRAAARRAGGAAQLRAHRTAAGVGPGPAGGRRPNSTFPAASRSSAACGKSA